MPYVRYRGPYAVLVHACRRGGKVAQRHLAYLGRRTRVETELRRRIEARFPEITFEWEKLESGLRGGAGRSASNWLEED
ncbi:MAG: hypothetical protein A2Y64_07765 [Candidatus Coatesbacteria bacterium RBG_13_66_14]|uniref:Uncharacterized protein n=1 Tax=Candidatus Coatesbacteria bacterium RBG_13_66_14 TaxID=1817816 RepID=A0A1F5FB39_9BACT|nr:MAG: hypothetical protein A2Y64_07765 [Candidatus Coatesbacteria bacterium RBG_13_66_14]